MRDLVSNEPSSYDSDAIQTAIRGLLDQHPEAMIAALDESFTIVGFPSSISLAGQRIVASGSLEELIHPDDRAELRAAWDRLSDKQGTLAQLRLVDDSPGTLQFLDARPGEPVVLAVWVPTKPTAVRRRTVWRQDEVGVIQDADAMTTELLGWDRDEVIGRRSLELIHPEDQSEAIQHFINMRTRPGPAAPIRLRHLCQNGSWLWLEVVSENLPDETAVTAVRSTRIDVQAEMEDEALEEDRTAPALPRFMRWRQDELGVIREIDVATTQLLGYTSAELVGRRSLDLIHPDDHESVIANWMEMLLTPGLMRQTRSRHLRKDGSWMWVETTNHNLLHDPAHNCVHAEKADVSKEMAAFEAVRAREQLLHRLAESLPQGVVQIDAEQRIVYTNARTAQVLGVEQAQTLPEQVAYLLEDDRIRFDFAVAESLSTGSDHDLELCLRLPGCGTLRRVQVSLRALTDTGGGVTGAILSILDVTDSVALREELRDRATFDTLTRCYNRAAVLAELRRIISDPLQRSTKGAGVAVLFIDLDLFKSVNDRLGHAAGDELLVAVARRLRESLRDVDVLGRPGGDEFLVICPDVQAPAEALLLADRLASVLHGDVELTSGAVPMRASVGVSWQAAKDAASTTLVQQADLAMYESKRRRQGQAVLYTPALLGTPELAR